MMTLSSLHRAVRAQADKARAIISQRFFKTGKGEYAEGDVFMGLTVPQCRALAKEHRDLALPDIERLLRSKIHEERLVALLILVQHFSLAVKIAITHRNARPSISVCTRIIECYLKNSRYVNNWDLVDTSAPKILGAAMFNGLVSRHALLRFARSTNLWERRIAMVATLYLIQHDQYTETLRIARILLHDSHDLIHKAVGWMLREVGKRNLKIEEQFVRQYAAIMPRTMLRYAIERWPELMRKEVML
jgi:3-methyladenine DNA glycosylase AlkD